MHSPHWSQCHFVVLDIEGNGGSPQEIVEIAVVHILDGQLDTARDWKVRPQSRITPRATRLHGITNDDLADQPRFAQIAHELQAELDSTIIVGHHVGVDLNLLRRQLPDWCPGTCIDTLRLARHVFPEAGSYALGALHQHVGGGDSSTRHRAKEDARMTAVLFLTLASKLSQTMHLDLLALARIGSSLDAPILQAQQGSLF
jgi:DNA polymerase III epsilon subunit-like protein